MAALPISYSLSMYMHVIETEDNLASNRSLGALEVRVNDKYRLQLKNLDGSILLVDEVGSPSLYHSYHIPSFLVELPDLRKEFLFEILARMNIDSAYWERFGDEIQPFMVEAYMSYGNNFLIVANIEGTRTHLVDAKDVDWSAVTVATINQVPMETY